MTISAETRTKTVQKTRPPDFSLIVQTLENRLMRDEDVSRHLQALLRENVWPSMTPDLRMKLSRLAQMAGDIPAATGILDHLNRTQPERLDAWREHLELLAVLGRKEALAVLLAKACPHADEQTRKDWQDRFQTADRAETDRDIARAAAPFDRFRTRRHLVDLYMDLFKGREDCFARQWADRANNKQGYVPVRHPMEPGDVEDHLAGRKTYGIYLMHADSTVSTAVIDIDIKVDFREKKIDKETQTAVKREYAWIIDRIRETAAGMGLAPLMEFSGSKGLHCWFFFAEPVEAAAARRALEDIRRRIEPDLSCFDMEVFPKQDQLSGKGFGNLVKLPLGIHRLKGKASHFIECRDRSVEAQLEFLRKVRPADPEVLQQAAAVREQDKVCMHPRMREWAEQYPELAILENMCPPIGHIIAACRQRGGISLREEKVLCQSVGFLPRRKTLMHYLLSQTAEYNPHLVDYRLSRVRGTPLGCKRIHSLLNYGGDFCRFEREAEYHHPLLHIPDWVEPAQPISEKIENLQGAIENLKLAIRTVEGFI